MHGHYIQFKIHEVRFGSQMFNVAGRVWKGIL